MSKIVLCVICHRYLVLWCYKRNPLEQYGVSANGCCARKEDRESDLFQLRNLDLKDNSILWSLNTRNSAIVILRRYREYNSRWLLRWRLLLFPKSLRQRSI
jgi:hypothetical protein